MLVVIAVMYFSAICVHNTNHLVATDDSYWLLIDRIGGAEIILFNTSLQNMFIKLKCQLVVSN